MQSQLRNRIYRIVFGTDTRAGKLFDIVLLWLILASVMVVMLESVPRLSANYKQAFYIIELLFTALFTFEYLLRIWSSPKPSQYIFSYWGAIDLLGIIPFFLSLVAVNYHYLVVWRLLRLLRVFRILRLLHFVKEAEYLFTALRASMYKIVVFVSFVLAMVIVLGTLMYVVEGSKNGFTSIPQSIYWTIVTITTVGYGDITPQTGLGKWIASVIMLSGYAIIAVPTGIVTVEMVRSKDAITPCEVCKHMNPSGSNFCNQCGAALKKE
jgi:voltage-gated potassium channel